MKLSNDTYCVTFKGARTPERYYRDRHGWVKARRTGRSVPPAAGRARG